MDARIGLCAGCHRTLDEIAAWSLLDDNVRRAVIAELPARRRAVADVAGPDSDGP